MRTARGGTNIYRQQDPTVTRNLGTLSDPIVTAVTIEDDGANTATIYFSAPVRYDALLPSLPAWTCDGNAMTAIQAIAADGMSVEATFAGTFDLGTTWAVTSSAEDHFIAGVTGGYLAAGTGQVSLYNPALGTLNVLSANALTPGAIVVTFDQAVCIPVSTGSGNNPDLTSWACSGANALSIDTYLSPTQVKFSPDTDVTSGTAYSFPGGSASFISLRGQPLAAKTGVLT
jgi:hypothetical protein